jgi:hypothetical protein
MKQNLKSFLPSLAALAAIPIIVALITFGQMAAFGQASVVDSIGGVTGNVLVGGLTGTGQYITSGQGGSITPLTGQTIVIPNYQTFTAITPAGTLAALTINLPLVAGQGQCTQFMTSAALSSGTIAPSTGFTIVGAAVSAASISANTAYTYCLNGTVWYRTQ